MNESPDRGLQLDDDVAEWLHELAEREYAGDVSQAMNESLRAMKIAMTPPYDPWAAVKAQAGWKVRRSGKPATEVELRQERE